MASLGGCITLPFERPGTKHVYYAYVIETDDRDALRAALAAQDVQDWHPLPVAASPPASLCGFRLSSGVSASHRATCQSNPLAPSVP